MNDNREMQPGETMFEFLKRKKKGMLENTLIRNRNNVERHPLKDKNLNGSCIEEDKQVKDGEKENMSKSLLRKSKINQNNSVTPKRVTIVQEEKRPITRSFLQMISPLRNKSPVQKQMEKSFKNESFGGKKDSSKENYTKKMIIEKVNNLRNVIEGLIRTGKQLKQKTNFLFVDIKPFFRHLQNCQDSAFEKKTQDIKAKLKTLQYIFKDFSLDNGQDSLDAFYQFFSQHLNELEGYTKSQIQQSKNTLTLQITTAKNRQIYELKQYNKQLQRQLQGLTKKYDKLVKNYQELKLSTENDKNRTSSQHTVKAEQLQQEVAQLSEDLRSQLQQNDYLKERVSKFEGDIKQLNFQKQKFQQECLTTITKVKTEQQQFLLNQIMVLKRQFNADIMKITELHKIKEEQLLVRLKNYQVQNQHFKMKTEELLQGSIKMDETISALKAQGVRFKKQNQCLATDMHRINEQLYQHWLALKDIKTLSVRLDIFHKFKKIYQQLFFNEQLFL